MKKIALATVALLILSTQYGCATPQNGYRGAKVTQSSSTLSQQQINDLLFMYEEEKVARDVYAILGKHWNARVFLNITQSEQRHMDAIKSVLDKYNVRIGVSDNLGSFTILALNNAYLELSKKGSLSLKDALEVGVAIEKMDIADLEKRIPTASSDTKIIYQNLLEASRKHLSAFERNLANGGDCGNGGGRGQGRR